MQIEEQITNTGINSQPEYATIVEALPHVDGGVQPVIVKRWFKNAAGMAECADVDEATAAWFRYSAIRAETPGELAEVLGCLSSHEAIIPGTLLPRLDAARQRRRYDAAKWKGEIQVVDRPWGWFPVDLDSLPAVDEAGEFKPLDDLPRTLAVLRAKLPEWARYAVIVWQFTAGMGLKPGIRARGFIKLTTPLTAAEMKVIADRDLGGIADLKIYQPNRLIYAGPTIFAAGIPDPLPAGRVTVDDPFGFELRADPPLALVKAKTAPAVASPQNVALDADATRKWASWVVADDLAMHGPPEIGEESDDRIYRLIGVLLDGPHFGQTLSRATIADLLHTEWAPHFDRSWINLKVTGGAYQNAPGCGPAGEERKYGALMEGLRAADEAERAAALATEIAVVNWPHNPVDLFGMLAREPKFDADRHAPPLLVRYARSLAPVIGAGSEMDVLAPALTMCSGVMSDDVKLYITSAWEERACVWFGRVSESGSLKTAPLQHARKPIEILDKRDRQANGRAVRAHKVAEQRAKLIQATFTASPDYDGLAPELFDEEKPEARTRLIGKLSTAGLRNQLAKAVNRKGVIITHDELSVLVAGIDGHAGGTAQAAGVGLFVQLKDGGPLPPEALASAGLIHVENWSAAVFGNVQTSVIREYLGRMTGVGWLARFMLYRGSRRVTPDYSGKCQADMGEYMALIEYLDALEPQTVRYSTEALEIQERMDIYGGNLADAVSLEPLRFAFNKLAGEFARWCHLYHAILSMPATVGTVDEFGQTVLKLPTLLPPEIPESTALMVYRLFNEFLIPETERIYHELYSGKAEALSSRGYARRIGRWLLASAVSEFTKRDVDKFVRRSQEQPEYHVQEALGFLEQSLWIAKAAPVRTDSERWLVNPVLQTRFADHAEAERRRRAEYSKRFNDRDAELAMAMGFGR